MSKPEEEDRYVGDRDLTQWPTPVGQGAAQAARRTSERVGSTATLLITLAIGLVAIVGLVVAAAQVYDAVTDRDGVAGLDRPLLQFALGLRSPVLDTGLTWFTDIAGPIGMPILAVTFLLVLAIGRRSWTPAALILAAGAGSLAMTIAGKDLIGRVRPPLADAVPPFEYSPSFPSGHTLNAIVIAGVVAYLFLLRQHSRRARVATVVGASAFALAIGLSRVFLGHHWFTDVLAGWLLGAAWLAIVITAHRLFLTTRRHPAARPDADRPARPDADPPSSVAVGS